MTPLADLTPPFVLLDDARGPGAPCRLYVDPVRIVTTRRIDDVAAALDAIRMATRAGLHAAGYLTYEAGAALDPPLPGPVEHAAPLLWFGLFEGCRVVASDAVARALPDAAGAWAGAPRPTLSRDAYMTRVAEAKALIVAGDIYQANLTFRARVPVAGHPLALYAGMRARSAAGYGAVVATGPQSGNRWLLSLSPELFFTLEAGALTTRPMKGTAPRDTDPALLAADPKQRAENLMIVDLLRNDLSRVALAGSVRVPELFAVESYPTLHQMTSTVTATLAPGLDAVDALAALFPCGSITGAPKHRAREVIASVEKRPRGAYTGAIGRIDAGGAGASFSVAIRTLEIDDAASAARIGLGAGIVADSDPASEWRECLAKGGFVASDRAFDLVETMRFDPVAGFAHLDRHLARLAASAAALGFALDGHGVRNMLQAATFRLRAPARVRLLLARSGATAVEVRDVPPVAAGSVAVRIVPLPVDRSDFRLCHKTTDRAFYDQARRGAFEVVFARPGGWLTEGSFTNVFVERGGVLVTPPASRGLLGGVLRAALLDAGRAVEGELHADDLDGGFFIGNALRGLLPARLAAV